MESANKSKVWKEKSPGTEQLLLEEMFQSGCIATYATAENVRLSHELFKEFPLKTFAAHFRKTKALLGEFLVAAKGLPGGVIPLVSSCHKSSVDTISELGSKFTPPPMKRVHSEKTEAVTEISDTSYMTWKFTDHELQTDYICVAISIFSGTKSVHFDIAEDGLNVIIKFSWPTAMRNPDEMFAQGHSMMHAFTSTLLEKGITDNSQPEGKWVIPLPCKVRREVTSNTMTKVVSDTTNIILLKFTAYQNDTIIEYANRSMSFE